MPRILGILILAGLLALAMGSAALADQKQLSAGDPAWVLDNLSADQVDVSIQSTDGQFAQVKVHWKCACESGEVERENPVNVVGQSIAHMTLRSSGCRVVWVSLTCTNGQVSIQAQGSGRSY